MSDIRIGGRGAGKSFQLECMLTKKELQWIGEVKSFLEQMKYEPDEDSCMGMAFFEFRESEDWYWQCVNNMERIIKRHSLTNDALDSPM